MKPNKDSIKKLGFFENFAAKESHSIEETREHIEIIRDIEEKVITELNKQL